MPLAVAYQRIAERSLEAAHASLDAHVQEKGAFLAYHAFESTGCALSFRNGHPVGPAVNHQRKIDTFVRVAGQLGNRRHVFVVAQIVNALRNRVLYPEVMPGGAINRPENRITERNGRDLARRVGGIVRWVGRTI